MYAIQDVWRGSILHTRSNLSYARMAKSLGAENEYQNKYIVDPV